MTDFSPIEGILQEICDCAVQALGQFWNLTDFHPKAMHESFMASYVFDRLGCKFSMAPELMVRTIWDWNNPGKPLPLGVKPQRRIDLTLFQPQNFPKEDQHTWCLVEFKRNWGIENDCWRVKSLLPLLQSPFGAACGVLAETEASVRDWLPKETPPGASFVISKQLDVNIDGKLCSFVVAGYLFASAAPTGA